MSVETTRCCPVRHLFTQQKKGSWHHFDTEARFVSLIWFCSFLSVFLFNWRLIHTTGGIIKCCKVNPGLKDHTEVGNFGPMKCPCDPPPYPHPLHPPRFSRPAQLRAQVVEFFHRPVPPWTVHPELHRLRTRPGRRHDGSRTPPNQYQEHRDRVQDHNSTGTGSDRARCDPIRTRSRVIQIRSQI